MTDASSKPHAAGEDARQGLKLVIELAPLLVFFAVNYRYGLLVATVALMVATAVSLAVSYALSGKIAPMPLISGGLVFVFGALAWYFEDSTFIKIKPTIFYLLFAGPLLIGLLFGKIILQPLLGAALHIDADGWRSLSLRWGLFFVAMAVLNELVWRNFSDNTWATFKAFGFLPLTLLFGVLQVPLILRHQSKPT